MWFKKKKKDLTNIYFSEDWINEWKLSIETSKEYKKAAKNWNAPVLLKIEPAPEVLREKNSIGFYLDLQYGECHELKYATDKDTDSSDIILTASEQTWLKLIEQKKDPTMMILKGSLSLEKGSLVQLSTQRRAAKALLETAPAYNAKSLKKDYVSEIIDQNRPVKKNNTFVTTGKGLNFESFPMQLFQKAKKFGVWNPTEIDFKQDINDWSNLSESEKEIILHLSSLFMAGEEAVTLELLPLILTIAKEGRLEEEIYLTSFLWEEAKHTEFFSRFVKEVMGNRPDFERFHAPFYKTLIYDKLPNHLNNLYTDPSPMAQLKASGTYNMIVEGTLAETGYEAYYKMLSENNLMPGLQEGITKLKQDESRHIAYGLYLINRLLEENPECREPFENHLEEMLDDATNIIHEIFEPYDVVPFGLKKEWFLDIAIKQFQHRLQKIGF